ncbi:MAG TPA: CBS domain-containing protein, partial [Ktedonobacterales bacterium]|nr:CBS domain-containing protein [Ktedonobacterales bacterium]
FGIEGNFVVLSAWLMLALVFVKIVTTSLTIGSGGSGGVFGPGMVIGGFLGGALWSGLHTWTPWMLGNTPPGAFVVVGMGAFFGGIAKAPLAVILMVAEMTGEYSLIVPAMLATMVAYLVTGETSIYESQVDTRLDSPAHKDDYALPLLQSLRVAQAMGPGRATARLDTPVADLSRLLGAQQVASIPIVADGRLIGLVTAADIARVPARDAAITHARQIMSRRVVRVYPDEPLYQAWLRMAQRGLRQLAVVDRADPNRLLGVVTLKTIGRLLRQPILATGPADSSASLPVPTTNGATATEDVAVAAGSRARAPYPPAGAVPRGGPARVAEVSSRDPSRQVLLETDDAEDNAEDDAVSVSTTAAGPPDAPADTDGGAPAEAAALQRSPSQAHGDGDPLMTITVAQAMLRTPRLIVESEPLAGVQARLDAFGRALLVVDAAGELAGIVTRSDLQARAPTEAGRTLTAGDVAVRRLVSARPDETLRAAARRMSRLGLRQLPVVAPGSARPVGLLRRSDVLEAYARALGEEGSAPRVAAIDEA